MAKPKLLVRLTGYLLIFTVFTLLLLVGLEVYFRFQPAYGRVGFQFDKNLIWRLNPNLAAQKAYAQGQVGKEPFTLRFNRKGFRGPNIRKRKNNESTRIMVLGDSYTAGLDYPDEEIFTAQLEQQLNQSDNRYEVQNVSCPAWGSDQQFVYWKTEGIDYAPDVLVLMISPNDMREMYNKQLTSLKDGKINIKKATFPRKERLGWYLASRFSLFQYLQKNVLETDYGNFFNIFHHYPVNYGIKDSTDWDAPIYLKEPFAEVDQTYVLFDAILKDMKESCEQTGTKLVLVKIPTKSEFDGSYDTAEHDPEKITAMMNQIAQQNDLSFLNLNASLEQEADPLHIFMHWEYHFNKAGHDYVGKALYSFLKSKLNQ